MEPAISLAKESHHAIRRGKSKRAPASQENCVGLTNKTVGRQKVCFPGSRSSSAHVNDRGHEAVKQDYRAAGSGQRIGPVSDAEGRAT